MQVDLSCYHHHLSSLTTEKKVDSRSETIVEKRKIYTGYFCSKSISCGVFVSLGMDYCLLSRHVHRIVRHVPAQPLRAVVVRIDDQNCIRGTAFRCRNLERLFQPLELENMDSNVLNTVMFRIWTVIPVPVGVEMLKVHLPLPVTSAGYSSKAVSSRDVWQKHWSLQTVSTLKKGKNL